ncbi:MAG: SCO family protein [Betaproteobacteria bacterium]|nr:SCO family protein [Betaproteobacteria bacterium]MBL0291501.1 SCO family protein [Betaproteobacteria bacterium]
MRDPRLPGVDPNRLLLYAAVGLVLWLLAGLLFAQALPAGARLDPRDALATSQAAIGRPLGDYTLTAADGRLVRLADYRGRPLVVQFIYTGCFQVCPTTTRFLGRAVEEAQRALGRDALRVVTVGFNLPFDTPAAMREFQKRQDIDLPNWEFLGGDAPTIDGMARDLGFVWVPTASGYDHLTQVTILDGRGRVVRQIYGESFELPMFVAPLKEIVTGAPAPTQNLAELVERVRILCTVYDPRAGKYRLNYGLFIEIFAGFTVLGAVLYYLTNEWRRHRRGQPS